MFFLQLVLQGLSDVLWAFHAMNQFEVQKLLLTGSALFVLESRHIFHQFFLKKRVESFRQNWLLIIFRVHFKNKIKY